MTGPARAGPPRAGPARGPGSRERAGLDELRGHLRVGGPLAVRRAQSGQRARAAGRACANGRPGGRARSSGATGRSSPCVGISAATCASTLTGSGPSVQPNRRASRPKCVSTVMPGMPKALPSTTLAVLRPTPGSVTRSSSLPRHLAAEPLARAPAPRPISAGGLGAEEAGRLDDLLELLRSARRVVRGASGSARTASGSTMLTRLSVVCADRIVATISSSGVVKSSSVCASG